MSSSALQFPGIDAAIAAFESGGSSTSLSSQANNPGALVAGSFATQYGATGSVTASNGQQIATFPTLAQGQTAEDALVANYAGQGDTLSQLITNWSVGPNGTPTATTTNYINSVANALGVSPNASVSSLAGVGGSGSSTTASGTCSWTNPSACFSQWFGGFSWGRVGAFALGLIAIIGAILLFSKGDIQRAVEI